MTSPLAVALLTVGLLSTPAPTDDATTESEPLDVQLDVRSAALLRAVRGVAGQVEGLRGERFRSSIGAARTPTDLLEVLAELRGSGVLDPDRLAARGRGWSDIGLGGEASPAALYRALAADLDGIAYDPTAHRLLLGPDRLTERDFEYHEADDPAAALLLAGVRPDAPVVAHVLMHALQRERTGRDFLAESTDELLARAAWAEGEANLVAVRYLFSGLSLQEDILDATLNPSQYLEGDLVPAGVDGVSGVDVAFQRFVYFEGYAQAVERFESGRWERIARDAAREHTTRQVLHPEVEPIDATMPEPQAPFPGLGLRDRDTLGEQGIITFVSRLTGKDNLALQAGEGWAGDRLCRWEGPGGSATEWVARFASAADVEDFRYAVGRTLRVRFPGRTPQKDAAGHETLATDDLVFRIESNGNELRFVAASPELGRAWILADDPATPEE